MSTIFEFQVLFRGFVELHGKHEQERAVSGLSSFDDLIMKRGKTCEKVDLVMSDDFSVDAGCEVICMYSGQVLSNSDNTGSLSHEVMALTRRRLLDKTIQDHGNLEHSPGQSHDSTCMLLQAPFVIKVNESHELTLSSGDEYFASWLADADRNFLYENLIRPVFSALEQESESIAKVHTGALRISVPSSAADTAANACVDSCNDTDIEHSFVNHRAGVITSDCALMPSALPDPDTFRSESESASWCLSNGARALNLPIKLMEKSRGQVFVIGHELYLDMMSRFERSRYKDFLGRERVDGPQLTALEFILEKSPHSVCMVLWPEKDYCAIKPADECDDSSVTWLHALEEDTDAAASGDETRTCSSAGVLDRWWPLPEGKSSDRSWPRKVGFVMASAVRVADDLKSMYKAKCQQDGMERDCQKEYGYWRFVKHIQRKIMVLDYTDKKAMLLSPESLDCNWQDSSVKLPLLFIYEMEFVDMVNLPSVECNDAQALVALAQVLPVDNLPDSLIRIHPELLRHFNVCPQGCTQDGLQRLVDRLDFVETEEQLNQLYSFLKHFPFNVSMANDRLETVRCLDVLTNKYSDNLYDNLGIKGMEWLDDIREFNELYSASGLTRELLSHRGLACVNNISRLIYQAVYNCPVSWELFNSSSLITKAKELKELFLCIYSKHEESADFKSLMSDSWCIPDPATAALSLSDQNVVSRSEPLAVVDAEFLMGNYHNIVRAVGRRTIVIPSTVLTGLFYRRFHFDPAMKLIANHAQRAIIELGDSAVFYSPDYCLTSMVAKKGKENQKNESNDDWESYISISGIPDLSQVSAEGCEGRSGENAGVLCSDSCISAAICMQAYDVVLYTGNKDTARKANQLGVKTVFSGTVNELYSKQAQLRDQSVRQSKNSEKELRSYKELDLYTYDRSLSFIKQDLDELSWMDCYHARELGLPENFIMALYAHDKKLQEATEKAQLFSKGFNPGFFAEYIKVALRPPSSSVYREQMLILRRGQTKLSRELLDESMLITSDGMKKWGSEGVGDGKNSSDKIFFTAPGIKSQIDHCNGRSEGSEKMSDRYESEGSHEADMKAAAYQMRYIKLHTNYKKLFGDKYPWLFPED